MNAGSDRWIRDGLNESVPMPIDPRGCGGSCFVAHLGVTATLERSRGCHVGVAAERGDPMNAVLGRSGWVPTGFGLIVNDD